MSELTMTLMTIVGAVLAAGYIFNRRHEIPSLRSHVRSLETENAKLKATFEHLHYTNIEKEKQILDAVETTKNLFKFEVESLKEQLSLAHQNKFAVEENLAKEKSFWLVKVEEEKKTSYEKGHQDATKDYSIKCEPFVKISKNWIGKKTYKAGYRYQLFVKNFPALESKDLILKEVSEVDENVRKLVIEGAKVALSTIARSQGIPIHFPDEPLKLEDEKR